MPVRRLPTHQSAHAMCLGNIQSRAPPGGAPPGGGPDPPLKGLKGAEASESPRPPRGPRGQRPLHRNIRNSDEWLDLLDLNERQSHTTQAAPGGARPGGGAQGTSRGAKMSLPACGKDLIQRIYTRRGSSSSSSSRDGSAEVREDATKAVEHRDEVTSRGPWRYES